MGKGHHIFMEQLKMKEIWLFFCLIASKPKREEVTMRQTRIIMCSILVMLFLMVSKSLAQTNVTLLGHIPSPKWSEQTSGVITQNQVE